MAKQIEQEDRSNRFVETEPDKYLSFYLPGTGEEGFEDEEANKEEAKEEEEEDATQHEEHSYSSTQFNLPGELAFEVRMLGEIIPSEDLVPTDCGANSSLGRELNPHVTVKYGLHTEDGEEVRKLVQGFSPIAIQLGPTSHFEGEKYDVVKIEVESKQLHELNRKVSESLPHTDTFPDYNPHITIAYVKRGLGEYWARRLNLLQGRVAVFDRLIFSDRNRIHTPILLTGSAQFSERALEGEHSLPFNFPSLYNKTLSNSQSRAT